ncbi:hypothetical protein ACB092_01G314500 [Castanea dentata]
MSKPRVTITLGRSGGQVVKGEGNRSGYAHARPRTNGSKWSREERFRSNANGFWSTNKRQQGNGINRGRGDIGVHDSRMSPNDLRLKLINKRKMKRVPRVFEERRKMDQSQKLSKTIQPARHNMQQQRSELKGHTFLWRATERPRSPNRNLKSSRGLSPQRNFDELHQVPSLRAPDNSRTRWILSNDGASRPTGPLTVKGPDTSELVMQLTPIGGIGKKSFHSVEESHTVTSLLQSLGLGKYNIIFRAEEVDMTALKQMGDKDLKDMGIPMGPRKKILLALWPRSRREQP